MSTVFGVYKYKQQGDVKIEDQPGFQDEDNFIPVAFRGNGTGIKWTNGLAVFLPVETKVYPLDNDAQGIFTIGDIITEINKQK